MILVIKGVPDTRYFHTRAYIQYHTFRSQIRTYNNIHISKKKNRKMERKEDSDKMKEKNGPLSGFVTSIYFAIKNFIKQLVENITILL